MILVTGGAGFIGANLCRRLLADGHEVICMDDYTSGRRKNVEALLKDPAFRLIEADTGKPESFAALPRVDQIYHLACPASPVFYQKDPIRTLRTCVYGMDNALTFARACGARVLQASTSEVYGDPAIPVQHEGYFGNVNPNGVRSCYDEGKRAAETLCCDYRRSGVDAKIVRIFNTYGPYMRADDGRLVSNFICSALTGKPLAVYGSGLQTRSLCFVSDLVEGLVRMMNSEESGPINLGNPVEMTVKEIAGVVLSLLSIDDPEGHLVYEAALEDDPKRRKPDIRRAEARLGWRPAIALEDGLRETIRYFRSELEEGGAR